MSFVRELGAGERLSYGLRAPLPSDCLVATVPLGYCDGVPRAYFDAGGEVLVNGRRCRLAGTVTMDQIVVDCGEDRSVRPGDEVVLIGAQGSDRITAEDWAAALGTISYEVVTRIGPRVKRVYRADGDGRRQDRRAGDRPARPHAACRRPRSSRPQAQKATLDRRRGGGGGRRRRRLRRQPLRPPASRGGAGPGP